MGNVLGYQNEENKEETCECGKTADQGGCVTPKYNPTLAGTIGDYKKHIIVCSGQNDWIDKFANDPECFEAKLLQVLKKENKSNTTEKEEKKEKKKEKKEKKKKNQKSYLLTAIDEKSSSSEGYDIIIYPEAIRYIGVTKANIPKFIDHLLNGTETDIKQVPLTFKRLVLVCTHMTRDKRCGRIGPQVINSLRELLKTNNIGEDQITIRGSSHLGGHKYAGVVVVYPEGDWYGNLTTRNTQDLLQAYLNGEVLSQNWRGNMNISAIDAKNRAVATN